VHLGDVRVQTGRRPGDVTAVERPGRHDDVPGAHGPPGGVGDEAVPVPADPLHVHPRPHRQVVGRDVGAQVGGHLGPRRVRVLPAGKARPCRPLNRRGVNSIRVPEAREAIETSQ